MDFGSIRCQEVSAMVRLLVDPNQVQSSSEFGVILSPVALRRLQSSWQFLFRKVILELMPADALAAHFHDVIVRYYGTRHLFFGLMLINLQFEPSSNKLIDIPTGVTAKTQGGSKNTEIVRKVFTNKFKEYTVYPVLPSLEV
jgi:hypothetical protein